MRNNYYLCPHKPGIARLQGEMAERSIVAVSKTVEGHTSGGSNPSLSVYFFHKRQVFIKLRICLYFYNGTPFRKYLIFSVLNLQKGTVDITKHNFNPLFVES